MNHFEHIKSMNIDEFAKYWSYRTFCEECPAQDFCSEDVTYDDCPKIFKQWLESEVEWKNY